MSRDQQQALDALLRHAPLDLGGELQSQREIFAQMMGSIPSPEDVSAEPSALGAIPTVNVSIRGQAPIGTILYFHGGAYAIGSAALAVGLASDVARRANARAISVEYRLAPEHPYPAGIDDAVSAYRALLESGVDPSEVVFCGESAGGGVVIAALVALTATDLPQPAAAYVMSPWVDLTLSGDSLEMKALIDPALTPRGLRLRSHDYLGAIDPSSVAVSPIFADLTGLAPLLIQAGGNEILLSDATRLATKAALDGVEVSLEVTPDVPHVFQGFAMMLDEGAAALDSGARFIRKHLSASAP